MLVQVFLSVKKSIHWAFWTPAWVTLNITAMQALRQSHLSTDVFLWLSGIEDVLELSSSQWWKDTALKKRVQHMQIDQKFMHAFYRNSMQFPYDIDLTTVLWIKGAPWWYSLWAQVTLLQICCRHCSFPNTSKQSEMHTFISYSCYSRHRNS